MQDFTNDGLVPSIDFAIQKIAKLPLPYTGNKKKLINHIYQTIMEQNIEFNSVLDAFSGSGTVSYLFKVMGKKVISNDLLTSSYMNSVAFVENPGVRLTDDEKEFLIKNKNKNKSTFVEDNYCGEGSVSCRFKKFTKKECEYLDNFRANIDELCGIYPQSVGFAANAAVVMRLPFGNVDQSNDVFKHRLKQQKEHGKHDRRIGIYYDDEMNLNFDKWFSKYVDDFTRGFVDHSVSENKIKRASFLANINRHILRDCMVQGRLNHGQVLAELDVRVNHKSNRPKGHYSNNYSCEMDFITNSDVSGQGMRWWNFSDINYDGSCIATNTDILSLLKTPCVNVDVAYFDPPYGGGSSDYASMYRFLEEYIYSQPLEDLAHIQANSSKFVKKKEYENNFCEMLTLAKNIPIWMFSYNDNSWKDIEYISNLISNFKKNVQTIVLDDNYRYLYRKNQGRGAESRSIEYLIIAKD